MRTGLRCQIRLFQSRLSHAAAELQKTIDAFNELHERHLRLKTVIERQAHEMNELRQERDNLRRELENVPRQSENPAIPDVLEDDSPDLDWVNEGSEHARQWVLLEHGVIKKKQRWIPQEENLLVRLMNSHEENAMRFRLVTDAFNQDPTTRTRSLAQIREKWRSLLKFNRLERALESETYRLVQ